jgi:formate dehydrogenase subunit gamma
MNSKIQDNGGTIVRFSLASRIGHWLYAALFIVLFLTGLAIAVRSIGGLFGTDALKFLLKTHLLLGYFFAVPVVILLLFSTKSFARWIRDIFTFTKNDASFITSFIKEFFGGKTEIPPQGRYNGGEKINSIIQIAGFLVMLVTGILLHTSESHSAATLGWAKVIHSFCGLILGGVIIGHAYLGLFHRPTKASLKGMLTGKVDMKFAKSHHSLWVEEVEKAESEEAKR